MLTFFFWRNFSFFFIPRLKIIFFFQIIFFFYALAFCFFSIKRKRSLSLSFTFTFTLSLSFTFTLSLSFTFTLSLSLSDKFFGGRGKKSGGDRKIAVARGKSQGEKHFFKDFLTQKSSKRLTYCFLNHEKISVLKLLL